MDADNAAIGLGMDLVAEPRDMRSSPPPADGARNQRNMQRMIQRNMNRMAEDNAGMIRDDTALEVQRLFLKFLESFNPPAEHVDPLSSAGASEMDERSPFYYIEEVKCMMREQSNVVKFNWNHLVDPKFFGEDTDAAHRFQDLATVIMEDFYRYEPYLCAAIQNFVRNHEPDYVRDKSGAVEDKDFSISIYNYTHKSVLRELKTNHIGQLTCFSGTITRTSEVRPELVKGFFTCKECGTPCPSVEQEFKYTEPTKCLNPNCQNSKNWNLDISRSKFVDWQKARVQEHSEDIPAGSMPRSIDVILRNECVEEAKPGDSVQITGTLVVVPDVGQMYGSRLVRDAGGPGGAVGEGVGGLKSMGARELCYKLVYLACSVINSEQIGNGIPMSDDNQEEEEKLLSTLSQADKDKIVQMGYHTPNLYSRLANCIAPNIFGHDNIKKGILLQMFGGVHKETHDGVKLRGDINVCIVGDPSTAKSQFLKFVDRVMPRTVYTSGKASSSAGLTASVQRDPETGEFGIEAGALMLADNGICCIDEFDKMDEIDQAAIHEAMEQQTITITKAGIQATLNARASILAAANPIWGRYDVTKSLRMNVNLSAPIMSRFDLFFVVLDECDAMVDYNVAQHIVALHREVKQIIVPEYTTSEIQKYIRFARTVKPKILPESRALLVRYYVKLRQQDAEERKAYRFTVRQLESMIRLSEALARVHLDDEVKPKFVREAARLLKKSIISVDSPDVDLDGFDQQDAGAEQAAADEEEEGDGMEADDGEEVKKKMSVTYAEYVRITNRIVAYIRSQPRVKDSEGDFLEPHVNESQLDEWYTELVMNDHGDEDEEDKLTVISQKIKTFRYVVERLVRCDMVLIRTRDENDQQVVEVHPNYDPETDNTQRMNTQRPAVKASSQPTKAELAEAAVDGAIAASAQDGVEDVDFD